MSLLATTVIPSKLLPLAVCFRSVVLVDREQVVGGDTVISFIF